MKRKCKAVLSIWMILAVSAALIPSVCLSALAGWGGGTTEPQMNTEGYYLIDSGEKLAWFSSRVNSGNKTIKAKQTASFDMSSRPFTPIGTATYPFLGKYDGGGYTISNLKVSVTTDNAGLFGFIGASETTTTMYDDYGDPYTETITAPAEINNVVLEDADIGGAKNVGGIAGTSAGGAVFGCSVSGTVSGTGSNVGGVVGYNYNQASITNSLNTATVSGSLRVGGIAGFNLAESSIDGCCNTGSISAGSYVGGIVGTSSGSDCSHSYNKGDVTAAENVCGGLVGYGAYGSLYCMYTIGTVTCPGDYKGIAIGNSFYGTAIERVYYDRDITTMTDDFATPAEHALMLDSSFIVTLNYGRDIFVDDYFHTNDNYPLLRWQLIGWDGSLGEPSTDVYGTYQITNGSELAWFAALVNGTLSGTAQNTSANAKVMRDILLNPPIFDETSNTWTPIGSVSSPFTGTFDGGEYRISGLYINDDTLINQGLFGRIGSGGVVKNIFLASSRIIASEGVGAISGSNYGTIQNCFNYSYIRSSYYTGGISGSNNGTIQNCGNSGEILGSVDAGGITGENTGGTITSCFNMEHVYALQHAGGIIGTNYGSIHYCYNNGKVEGAVSVGGLVGYQSSNIANSFTACYNIGPVSGAQNVGAVVGYNIPGSVTLYCYYDTDRSGVTDKLATPKTTDEMAGSTLSSFQGFTSSYWVIRTPDTYFNYCPELRIFYNSSNTLLKNTSKNSAAVLKPQFTVQAEIDGEMPTYYPTTAAACAHIGTGAGTLILVRDATVSQTTEILGTVRITNNEKARTLTRASNFTGSFFLVSNSLTLTGTQNNRLVLNGGADNGLTGEALLNVNSNGTLTVEDGALLTKNDCDANNGGAISVNGGYLQMSGGTVSGNTAKYGGAIYVNGGVITADGGTLSGNTATNGGGIFFDARTTESTLNDLTLTGNTATYGGAFYNRNSTVIVTGGSITGNTGSNTGGAVYNTGTVDFRGGSVTGNSAQTAVGVFQNGTLQLSGTVYFGESDNIYLPAGKTVSNPDRITRSGIIAYLTAANYAEGVRVLDGDACAANYAKYVMNVPSGFPELNINSSGCLIAQDVSNVAMVSKFGLYDVYYTSLKEAVDAIGADETGLVTMISDDLIEETIEVRGNVTVTILGDEESNRTLTRYRTCTGAMFTVAENGTLEFGSPSSENDAALIVDGGSDLYGTYGDSIVINNGTLRVRDGATLCNAAKNGNGAAVMNNGTMEMSGGSITNCTSADGGAIYNSGTLQITGGSINHCTAANGGAIRSTGTLSMQAGTLSENHATTGGAVYSTGSAAMEGGTIRANTATNGGGVCFAGGTWDLRAGKLTVITTDGSGESVFAETDVTPTIAENTATANGGGVYALGGTGTFSAGTVRQNAAKHGGGMYLADGSTCVLSSGVLQNNTASTRGGGVYDDGTLTLSDATIDTSNDVYIAAGKTVIPTGTAVSAVLTPYTYTIGTQLLSGSSVAALYGGFTIANDRFFLASDGTLNTRTLSVKESSSMFVDYEKGLVLGLDPAQNTVDNILAAFDNAASSLSVTDADGTAVSGDTRVTTGYIITLRNGSSVLDSKVFVLVGDVDADGKCNAEDAVIVYARAAGKLTDAQLGAAAARAADADNNGVINYEDGALLRACGMFKTTVTQPTQTAS